VQQKLHLASEQEVCTLGPGTVVWSIDDGLLCGCRVEDGTPYRAEHMKRAQLKVRGHGA
jgi:hypothetical protein